MSDQTPSATQILEPVAGGAQSEPAAEPTTRKPEQPTQQTKSGHDQPLTKELLIERKELLIEREDMRVRAIAHYRTCAALLPQAREERIRGAYLRRCLIRMRLELAEGSEIDFGKIFRRIAEIQRAEQDCLELLETLSELLPDADLATLRAEASSPTFSR